MKIFVLVLMTLQVILFGFGVVALIQGHFGVGLFNMALNAVFFCINLLTLSMIREQRRL